MKWNFTENYQKFKTMKLLSLSQFIKLKISACIFYAIFVNSLWEKAKLYDC